MAVFLLLAAMTAGAQVPNSPAQETLSPGVTVTGKAVHSGPPLPKIPPDEFADCVRQQAGMGMSQYAHGGGTGFPDLMTLEACQIQMDWEKNVVLRACINREAFADSGDRAKAVSDLRTAVGLDPSLASYVAIKGKTASLQLPPL